jgi:serine acetyltransferase
MGVVIGETARIGNNVTIYHGVTLGGMGRAHKEATATIENNKIVNRRVMIYDYNYIVFYSKSAK